MTSSRITLCDVSPASFCRLERGSFSDDEQKAFRDDLGDAARSKKVGIAQFLVNVCPDDSRVCGVRPQKDLYFQQSDQ